MEKGGRRSEVRGYQLKVFNGCEQRVTMEPYGRIGGFDDERPIQPIQPIQLKLPLRSFGLAWHRCVGSPVPGIIVRLYIFCHEIQKPNSYNGQRTMYVVIL